MRIPADKLDAFLTETGELLNVTSSNSNAEDISGKYYDIQARISVLETERQLVEKMLSEAAKESGRRVRVVEMRVQAPDHPALLNEEETLYLKFFVLQVV